MRLLLDTHVWLWLQVSPDRIRSATLQRLEDPRTELLLSAASSWEIAIKFALGRLALPEPPEDYVPSRLRGSGIATLPIEHRHALAVAALPPHHRDPFDRLLVAQTRAEGLVLVTADPMLAPYDIERLPA